MLKYSVELGNKLREALFVRRLGNAVTYEVRPGQETNAAETWAVHGVCLSCRRWCITAGRCAECATTYRPDSVLMLSLDAERMVQRQLEKVNF